MEILFFLIFWLLFFRVEYKEIWRWAKIDGCDIKKSDWLPEGYSPADLITEKEWGKFKKKLNL